MTSDADDERLSLPQRVVGLFLKGLATIIPIALTLLIVFWLAGLAERGVGAMIQWVLPEDLYIQGMGLVGGVLIVIAIGVLSQVWLFRQLIDLGEGLLDRVPLVKPVFRATKDFVDYFSGDEGKKFDQAVLVRHPDLKMAMMGYVTRQDFSDLPFGTEGEVAVYLPLSYQVAGYMIIVPKDWLEPVNMPFDESLRFVLTAGMSRRTGTRD